MIDLQCLSENASLPVVSLLLDANGDGVQSLEFGEWHCHPQTLDEAIALARQLIHTQRCIVEQRDRGGNYLGSGRLSPTELPHSISIKAAYLTRRFFGRLPVREEIDFSKYVRGKHLYRHVEHKAMMDDVWTKLGWPPPSF